MSIEPRHEFYETDQKVTITIFDKDVNPDTITLNFSPRAFNYENGEKKLVLEPLTGEIDPAASDYTVTKIKVEVRLVKSAPGRWIKLVSDDTSGAIHPVQSSAAPGSNVSFFRKPTKDWSSLSDAMLDADPDDSFSDDPGAGEGLFPNADDDPNALDSNRAFADLFANVDDDAKRAMMKSYTESAGTTLSTDWDDVQKGPVSVKPPEGQ